MTSQPLHSERRKASRIDTTQQVVVRANGSFQQMYTVDLSLAGANIFGTCPVEVGKTLQVDLYSNGIKAASLTEVIRIEPNDFSVHFLHQSSEFKTLLSDLLYPTWIGGQRLY